MHFCIAVFTEYYPTPKQISEIMTPYYEYREDIGENDPDFEWDWYVTGGRYTEAFKFINPSQKADYPFHPSELLDYAGLEPYGFIDVDKKPYIRETWSDGHYKERLDYLEKLEEIKKKNKNCWITIVDCHI